MADEPLMPMEEAMGEAQVAEVSLPATANPNSPYAWPKERRLLSTRVNRIDGPQKVAGNARRSVNRPAVRGRRRGARRAR